MSASAAAARSSATHHCAVCNVTSNSDASHTRHLASKAHRKRSTPRAACNAASQTPKGAAVAAVSVTLSPPLPAPVSSSPILSVEPCSPAFSRLPAAASSSASVPSSVCPDAVHSLTDLNAPSKTRQPDSVCKSSNAKDDSHESAESDRSSSKSSSNVTPHSNSSSNHASQQHDCCVCKLTLHSDKDWHAHLRGNAHIRAEQAYVRGMLAAITYVSKCLPIAPCPPSAAAAVPPAAALLPPSASPALDTFLSAAHNPALCALIDSLQQHQNGLAWRSFIDAVSRGLGAVAHWRRNLQLENEFVDDGNEEYFDGDEEYFDDEADIYDEDCY
jgi:hypothetical protein